MVLFVLIASRSVANRHSAIIERLAWNEIDLDEDLTEPKRVRAATSNHNPREEGEVGGDYQYIS